MSIVVVHVDAALSARPAPRATIAQPPPAIPRTCAEWVNPADCGLDSDGSTCATSTNAQNQKICIKIDGRFFANGACADQCLASEQCVLPVSGGVECVLPRGAAA
jgi:hypothetical protein